MSCYEEVLGVVSFLVLGVLFVFRSVVLGPFFVHSSAESVILFASWELKRQCPLLLVASGS